MPDEGRSAPLTVDAGFAYCPSCGTPLVGPRPVRCRACGTTHWRNAKPCGAAMVVADGRLLLVRRGGEPFAGWWDIPGGFCEPTELPEQAAVREVYEETGIRVRTTGLLGMWIDRYEQRGIVQDTLNVYFHAVPVEDVTATPEPGEVIEIRWFGVDALPEPLAFPDHTSAVLEAWRRSLRV